MEKISGILPATQRITSVDRSLDAPVRSGHGATFGRQIAASEVISRGAPKLTLAEAPKAYERLSERKLKDRMHADIVQRMSSDFFGKSRGSRIDEMLVPEPTLPAVNSDPMTLMAARDYSLEDAAYGDFATAVDAQKELQEPFFEKGTRLSLIA